MRQYSITLKDGSSYKWTRPLVMGIINITPDSFYTADTDLEKNIELAGHMCNQGADILDLGAMSTRPGAEVVSPDVEWERLSPLLGELRKRHSDILISIDTIHSDTAQKALDVGADMINDVSFGAIDESIWEVVRRNEAPYIGMHMLGMPSDMQEDPQYQNVVEEVYATLQERKNQSKIKDDKLILDIGIGFGKSLDHNYELLANMVQYRKLNNPLLVGISRKSLLYRFLGGTPHDMLSASSAMHMYLLSQGVSILRVHDVKEAVDVVRIWEKLEHSKSNS